MDETVDALVVGAGPAGTTAANLLRQYAPSARIVLVERAPFPRHHVGESTLPDANRILARLGALDAIDAAGFVKKGGISFKWRSDRPTFAERFADAPVRVPGEVPRYSYQVERSRYDALLLEAARAQGVEVWQPARAEQVLRDGEQVVGMVVDGRRVGTRHVVDATGQARLLGRGLGLTAESLGLGDLAIYRYFRNQGWPREVGEPALSQIFFAACPAGWLWFIPLAEDRV
ncbi:MAG: tryptophan 7-halogenase, partial [Myxococcota bacterium]